MTGYVKLYRKIFEWEWYKNANTSRLFIHLLLKANFEPNRWEGITIERGQLITSVKSLKDELKLTPRKIRTALDNLKKTNEITIETTNKFTLVTICKYDEYNDVKSKKGQTKRQTIRQSDDNQMSTIKEYKERKEEKNNSTPKFDLFWDTYDKKIGREKCLEAWMQIPESEIEKILEHVPRYVASTPDIKYRKNPLTYLTGKHWQDEIISRDTSAAPSNKTLDGRIKLAV